MVFHLGSVTSRRQKYAVLRWGHLDVARNDPGHRFRPTVAQQLRRPRHLVVTFGLSVAVHSAIGGH